MRRDRGLAGAPPGHRRYIEEGVNSSMTPQRKLFMETRLTPATLCWFSGDLRKMETISL